MIDYGKVLNPTVMGLKPSGIRKFFDIAESMKDVISLGVGEPDFLTPYKIRATAIKTLEQGKTRYSANRGLMPLREQIANYTYRKYGLSYNPTDEILVTVGGSEAIDMILRAVITPGDEVIIPQPSYVCYEPLTIACGGTPVIIPTKAEDNFKLTARDLKANITEKTKAVILPFPCNPTGAIMERKDLEELGEVLRDTNIVVISDEIYSELTYSGKHVSPANISSLFERTVIVSGFSKSFSMTGWRLGYAMGNKALLEQVTKLHQYAIMCAPTSSQYAAIEALQSCDTEVEAMVQEYNVRRKIMVNGFNKIGLTCREPNGAFYAFPCIKSTGMTSEEFCEKLLYSKQVAVVPGPAFGEGGEGFIRASYCYSTEHIKEALRRIEEFLKEIK